MLDIYNNDAEWMREQIAALTDEKLEYSVSIWAEQKRYLPSQVSSMPGQYSYDLTPYLREIADCMTSDSPVQVVDFMKGAQVGATVGVLENAIGYLIDHVKTVPVMLLTADAELAKLRVDSYITPMLQHSGLDHLIRSSDEKNHRKTGKTDKMIEWEGPGFLVPFGAQNADKLRSISIRYLLQDECDAFPQRVGKDGDPQSLAEARTKSYDATKKILRISTPLVEGSSRIARGFDNGDQRYYYVPCRECGGMQTLVFRKEDKQTGRRWGLKWSCHEGGELDLKSVRYVCEFCGHEHRNSDKVHMLPAGEWRATRKTADPRRRSYHINGLYSPVGMFSWESVVASWLEAWDEQSGQVRNIEKLQEFYNNVLGVPFREQGTAVSKESVSAHRRAVYRLGEIPNEYARTYSESKILLLTCTVDVHKRFIAVAVIGWTAGMRSYVIDYWHIERESEDDDCAELSSPVWRKLQELLEETVYTADDGCTYVIALTLIDANYATKTVCEFCAQYANGVVPIFGTPRASSRGSVKEFAKSKSQGGHDAYTIYVDHYKDRLGPVLRREWLHELGTQKPYHFNAPVDLPDSHIYELAAETRRQKKDDKGAVTYYWHRPGNARNELWDCLVYGSAAVEILAFNTCIETFGMDAVDWQQFWQYIDEKCIYYTPPE